MGLVTIDAVDGGPGRPDRAQAQLVAHRLRRRPGPARGRTARKRQRPGSLRPRPSGREPRRRPGLGRGRDRPHHRRRAGRKPRDPDRHPDWTTAARHFAPGGPWPSAQAPAGISPSSAHPGPRSPRDRSPHRTAAVCAFSSAAPVTRRYAAGPVSAEAAAIDPAPVGPALGSP